MLIIKRINIKIIFISAILILSNLFAFSQQKTLNYISNSYLTSTNHLNSLTSVANYRKQVSIPSEVTSRISENNAIYKLGFKKGKPHLMIIIRIG